MRLNLKRLTLLCGKAARACARVSNLTPARADLLALLLNGEYAQVQLATLLCVSEAVVSRMLRPLMALGFVRRRIPEEDRRLRIVSLTPLGKRELVPCLDDHIEREPDGTRGAQCIGENAWLCDWDKPLERLGLQFDPLLRLGRVDPLLFAKMRHWNRVNTYDAFFDDRHLAVHPYPLD